MKNSWRRGKKNKYCFIREKSLKKDRTINTKFKILINIIKTFKILTNIKFKIPLGKTRLTVSLLNNFMTQALWTQQKWGE